MTFSRELSKMTALVEGGAGVRKLERLHCLHYIHKITWFTKTRDRQLEASIQIIITCVHTRS